jgi:hypothetical protein
MPDAYEADRPSSHCGTAPLPEPVRPVRRSRTSWIRRVYLWCRAGVTAADLVAARHVLAGACWATEVRVIPSVRYAHLVVLEVIRNPHEERTVPTPNGWPIPRQVETGVLDDPEEPARSGLWGEPTVRSG